MTKGALEAPENADPTQRRFRGSAKLGEYEITDKLGEGTFGVVTKGRSKRTGAVVALKRILMHNEKDGVPITALREIRLLKMLSHPNVLKLNEMVVERNQGDGKKRGILYMVTPYMDHDLSGMTTNPDIQFKLPQIKCYMMQLLEGLRYLHDSHILHRDMKAANILINNRGLLQIADFGLARHYDGPTPRPGYGNGEATRDYTTLVVTRWYRPPELLLQLRRYTPAIDMWGAGCVFAEMFECRPILEGKSDLNQAEQIFELVGSPTEETMPGWSQLPGCEGVRQWGTHRGNITSRFGKLGPDGLDLLQQLLKLDYKKRINAFDALKHPYFKNYPLPARPEDLPHFEESHELDRRKHHEKRAALPPAPAGGTVGMGPDDQWNGSGPPNGSYSNGYARLDDRGRYPPRDRGPPGVPPPPGPPRGRYDGRGSGNPRDREDPGARQPAWQRGSDMRGPPPGYANGNRNDVVLPPPPDGRDQHGLPPRPPPARDARDIRDIRNGRDVRDVRDGRDGRDGRGSRDNRDVRDARDARDPPRRGANNTDTYVPSYANRSPRRADDDVPGYDGRRRGSREHAFRDRDRPRDSRRTRTRSPDRDRRPRGQDRDRDNAL